jgi:ribosomal protein L11 methyltransferase
MDNFWVLTLFQLHISREELDKLILAGMGEFSSSGAEEFSLNEPEVDALLGERSYSGGDLPLEVIGEVESFMEGGPQTVRFFFEEENQARAFQEVVDKNYLGENQLEKKQSADWNSEWKKHYSPIIVSGKLQVIPSWMKDSSDVKGKLFINPGMGFGTGSHETTFLCLKLLTEELHPENLNRVLDFGSGSGILGLAVFLFHPSAEIDFYDIDPEANKNAYENARINNFAELRFRLLLPEFREKLKESYDLIFANILQNVLLAERDYLLKTVKPKGHLILSGLLNHQVEEVLNSYKNEAKLIKHLQRGDWSALLLEKK